MMLHRLFELIRPPTVQYAHCDGCQALNEYPAIALIWSCWKCGRKTIARGAHIVVER